MSIQPLKSWVPFLVSVVLMGCTGPSLPTNQDNTGEQTGDGTANTTGSQTGDNGTGDATTDQGDAATGDGNNSGTTGDQNTGGPQTGAVALSGRINPGQTAKARPRSQAELYPYTVVAQSNETGDIYRGETNADGEFKVDVPAEETGSTFMVTILGPDGRAVGPVVLEEQGDKGVTGLALDRDADLGTIDLPDDPTKAPIRPGADGDAAGLADPALSARLNSDGAPVGLASVGKAAEAQTTETRAGLVDADGDGLIDAFDADDDGNGIVDDFEAGAKLVDTPPDVHVNFFMNLKIGTDFAPTYYTGDATQIAARLGNDTIITFEVMTEAFATRSIASAKLLETPGPAYLATASEVAQPGGDQLWASLDYALGPEADRFDAFVRPNAVMNAGDSFTLEVTFDDGSVEQYSRMINYVFKNIPKLLQYGAAGAMTTLDLAGGAVDGSPSHPILFDGSQDLVLEFNPPPDETGTPITGMAYTFQFFYQGATGGQLNGDINYTATWPTPIPNFDRGTYRIAAADLGALSSDHAYTVTLPRALFADTVTLNSGATDTVGSYKIDITAEAPSGNAAIMLTYAKR